MCECLDRLAGTTWMMTIWRLSHPRPSHDGSPPQAPSNPPCAHFSTVTSIPEVRSRDIPHLNQDQDHRKFSCFPTDCNNLPVETCSAPIYFNTSKTEGKKIPLQLHSHPPLLTVTLTSSSKQWRQSLKGASHLTISFVQHVEKVKIEKANVLKWPTDFFFLIEFG